MDIGLDRGDVAMTSDLSPDAVREARSGIFDHGNQDGVTQVVHAQHLVVMLKVCDDWLASRSGPSDQEVEAAAKALYAYRFNSHPTAWDQDTGMHVGLRNQARAALVAARQGVDSE